MPAKQAQKRSSVKENTKSSQPTRKSKKADYLQFTENRYKRMSDEEFVKAFEDDHAEEYDNKFTLIAKKTIPFFMANISREDREELQERFDVEDAYWQELLDQYPDLIGKIPAYLLYCMPANERLQLLLEHPDKAEFLLPVLQGEDTWAIMLSSYRKELQQIGIKLCPWNTMTTSQIRYMKLKSVQLKKFIESHKIG